MSIKRFVQLGVTQPYIAGGQFQIELAPVQGSITELFVFVRAVVTTTTATNLSDYWDRLIMSLSLTGGGNTYLQFSNMRAAHHWSRLCRKVAFRRPPPIANSQTNAEQQFGYVFHFGTRPLLPDGRRNKFDLSGGIPPVTRGNLTLGGNWNPASALGTNVTVQATTWLDVYAHIVQQESQGEDPARWMPIALPNFTMRSPTPVATSTPFATQDDVPGGDYLRSVMVMLTNGAGAPRASDVMSSLEIYDQRGARSIYRAGGQADDEPPAVVSEMVGQLDGQTAGSPTEDGLAANMGVPSVGSSHDAGLHAIVVGDYSDRAHPDYGLDLRNQGTGAVQLRYGIFDATGVTLDIVYEKFRVNPEHPGARISVGA